MLSRRAYKIAQKFRAKLDDRHFGHFDRRARHSYGDSSESETYSGGFDLFEYEHSESNQVIVCSFEIDDVTKEYTPVFKVKHRGGD